MGYVAVPELNTPVAGRTNHQADRLPTRPAQKAQVITKLVRVYAESQICDERMEVLVNFSSKRLIPNKLLHSI